IELKRDGDNLLIGTRGELYSYDGNVCQKFKDQNLNEILDRNELNHILSISDAELIFATVKNGLIQYNKNRKTTFIYNRNSGLQNNTVLGMAMRNGKIWVGLDNGIDVINLSSPVNFYTDDSGELGAVYDM